MQTASRGRAYQHRGAHFTYKLIFDLCAGFLVLKVINPHMFLYIYDYHHHHCHDPNPGVMTGAREREFLYPEPVASLKIKNF